MSDIEQRALELIEECSAERQSHYTGCPSRQVNVNIEALCRAIEAHDAERAAHDAFRQEVSEIASSALAMYQRIGEAHCPTAQALRPLIIQPKTDPLAEALIEVLGGIYNDDRPDRLRAALKSRGLEIREVE